MAPVVAALHFILAFTLVACLAIELALLRAQAERIHFSTLAKVDALYGASAGLLLLVGLYRATHFEKGWAYYAHSGPFLIKLALFALIAVLSIYPTVKFFQARRGDVQLAHATLNRIRKIVLLELMLVGVLIVCASYAAKGIGVVT